MTTNGKVLQSPVSENLYLVTDHEKVGEGEKFVSSQKELLLERIAESGEDTHVGPIIFAHPIARQQLVDNGEVISFRSSDRTTGETWWRESRTGEKKGDVTVECIGKVYPTVSPKVFEPFVDLSGFDSVDDWIAPIKEMHDGELPDDGYLFRVTKQDA